MTTPKEPAKAPPLPNASIDFDKVHKAAKAGKTGADLLKGAVNATGRDAKPARATVSSPASAD